MVRSPGAAGFGASGPNALYAGVTAMAWLISAALAVLHPKWNHNRGFQRLADRQRPLRFRCQRNGKMDREMMKNVACLNRAVCHHRQWLKVLF